MFYAEWSKTILMSQKDDDFTLQQRQREKKKNKKTKAGVHPLSCPWSLNSTRLVISNSFRRAAFSRNLARINLTVLSLWQENKQNERQKDKTDH